MILNILKGENGYEKVIILNMQGFSTTHVLM